MNKKIIGICIVMLLIGTVIPIVGSTDENYQNQIFDDITSMNNHKFPVMKDIFEPLDPKNASPKPTIIDTPDYFSWKDFTPITFLYRID